MEFVFHPNPHRASLSDTNITGDKVQEDNCEFFSWIHDDALVLQIFWDEDGVLRDSYLSQGVGSVVGLQQRSSPSSGASGVTDVTVFVHRLGQSHLDRRAIHQLEGGEQNFKEQFSQKRLPSLELLYKLLRIRSVSVLTVRMCCCSLISLTFPLRAFMALTASSLWVKWTKA